MRHKSEVLDKFKEFEALVTNYSGLSIGTLCTDNGSEYVSKGFEKYLKSKCIRHELIIPYFLAQNGEAERMNCILMESARTKNGCIGLPDNYWVEAVYIRNRVPTRAFKEWQET